MNRVKINEPIWKTRSVGIREDLCLDDCEIKILYVNKSGEREFPDTYLLRKNVGLKYPTKLIRGVFRLKIIPIADLEILEG
jgi:hypothetical protein